MSRKDIIKASLAAYGCQDSYDVSPNGPPFRMTYGGIMCALLFTFHHRLLNVSLLLTVEGFPVPQRFETMINGPPRLPAFVLESLGHMHAFRS